MNKIATISFELKGTEFSLNADERIKAITQVINQLDVDICLTAGWSLETNTDAKNLAKCIKKLDKKTTLIAEIKNDKVLIEKGHPYKEHFSTDYPTHNMVVIHPNGDIQELGCQYFITSEELNDKKLGPARIKSLEDALEQRIFYVGMQKCIVLCCGELNILKGRDNVQNKSQKLAELLKKCDVVLNPTHDLMGNAGTVIKKREFLSTRKSDQIYISASNYNTQKLTKSGKIKAQKPTSDTLHTVYKNGNRLPFVQHPLSKELSCEVRVAHNVNLTPTNSSEKPKGQASRLLHDLLKEIDEHVYCEAQFDWLFLPKSFERTETEDIIFKSLQKHCKDTASQYKTKKSQAKPEDIYMNDDKIVKQSRKLEFDFYLPKYNIAIELDELQHFTAERKLTFTHYPEGNYGYDIYRWRDLCNMKKNDADPPARDWQRAIRDAVRDLKAQKAGLKLVRLYIRDFDFKTAPKEALLKQVKKSLSI